MTTVLLVTFVLLLLLNVPVAFCMLLSSLAALLYAGINPIMMALETSRSLSNFYAFLAVPFFILAGEIMSQGGLSRSLINFVRSMIGHRKTGLPMVTVISSQMFGGFAAADAFHDMAASARDQHQRSLSAHRTSLVAIGDNAHVAAQRFTEMDADNAIRVRAVRCISAT